MGWWDVRWGSEFWKTAPNKGYPRFYTSIDSPKIWRRDSIRWRMEIWKVRKNDPIPVYFKHLLIFSPSDFPGRDSHSVVMTSMANQNEEHGSQPAQIILIGCQWRGTNDWFRYIRLPWKLNLGVEFEFTLPNTPQQNGMNRWLRMKVCNSTWKRKGWTRQASIDDVKRLVNWSSLNCNPIRLNNRQTRWNQMSIWIVLWYCTKLG